MKMYLLSRMQSKNFISSFKLYCIELHKSNLKKILVDKFYTDCLVHMHIFVENIEPSLSKEK